MTIKTKIFTMGGVAFALFVILALMNLWTHREVQTNLQVRDNVSIKLTELQEFAEWKNNFVHSILGAVKTGNIPPSLHQLFSRPDNYLKSEGELLLQSGRNLSRLVEEKQKLSYYVEKSFAGFHQQINKLYHKLDDQIGTVIAKAQIEQVVGDDTSTVNSLALHVLKSLNELTLIGLNSIVSRTTTEETERLIIKNRQYLTSQLALLDHQNSITPLFQELFAQIESLNAFILHSHKQIDANNREIELATTDFTKAAENNAVDSIVVTMQADLDQANKRLEQTNRHTLMVITIILFMFPIIVVAVGIVGANRVIIRPINRLIHAMNKVESGRFEVTAPVSSKDEIGRLAKAFNLMAAEIETKVTEMSRLNQNLQENEEKLRFSEERLELALEGANEGVWDWDLVNDVLHFDSRYYTMAGYEPYEFPELFSEWEKRVHPDDLKPTKNEVTRYLENSDKPFDAEFRMMKKDGTYMWIRGKGKIVSRGVDGTALRFTGTHSDITAEKQSEVELRSLRNYLSNIIDSMPSILVGIDESEMVTLWNKEAERATGLPADTAIGKPLETTISFLPGEIEQLRSSIKSRNEQLKLKRSRTESNTIIHENVTVYPLVSNCLEGAVIRIDNITREQELESQLNHSRKMDAIGQLAGGVAHDFNNMLSGILGAAQLLKNPDRQVDDKGIQLLDIIEKATTRAAGLTSKLLAFSRKGKILSTQIDAHKIVEDAVAMLRHSIDKKITISVNCNAKHPVVVGDPSGLQSAILNLGINASHAMQDGGDLSIETSNVRLDKTYCDLSAFDISPGQYLEVEIQDTGCGIPLENLQKIFEPFFTTKEQGGGVGLGLAAVYGTISDHHGEISVYSELNKGTTFHLLLPCSDEGDFINLDSDEIIPGTGRILLVDDEEIIRVTGKQMLEEMGYEVELACNGKEAVNYFRNSSQNVDLVIMDMIMPVMNGKEAIEGIRKINSTCKIIIASGFSHQSQLTDLRKHNVFGFIRKPYRAHELSNLAASTLIENSKSP